MTTRPGAQAFANLVNRTFRYCTLAKIVRTDGFTLRLTSHDRTLTFEGEEYQPIILADLSADRREGGLRSGNQEAKGIIDGTLVTIPDLYGYRYRDATVYQVITDWREPWRVSARHRKFIRSVNWTNGAFVATLEARSQVLTRPTGGRFGGTFATKCPYTLGDPLTCKKDVSIGSGFAGAGASVATIQRQRSKVRFDTATWPGTFVDGYFRDGSFEWMWSAPEITGTTTGALTGDNSLTDGTKTWTTDEHVGKWVRVLTSAGAGVSGAAYAQIVSNTIDTVFYDDNLPMSGFAAGQAYDICQECENSGVVSAIVYYTHATRECTFLLPMPFAIAVGDSGVWTAGCDGLLATCGDKFADEDHPANFGGDTFAPSAQALIEPPESS